MNVELYSRPNCHLCDEAKATLLEVQKEIDFELLEVNIETDPLLKERFLRDVPVVFVDGKAWFKHKVDKEDLKKRLDRARSFSLGTLDPQKTLSRTAPVSRSTKIGFSILVVAAIVAVFASKAYVKLVLDPARGVESLSPVHQDRPAPDFAVEAQGGPARTLASYPGKLLVLNFFATWCGPCRDEMPSMNALAQQTKGENIAVVAVDVQEDWPTLKKFFGEQNPAFDVMLDASGAAATAYEQKKGLQFPETFLITPSGKVVAKFEGARDWTDPAMLRYLRGLSRG